MAFHVWIPCHISYPEDIDYLVDAIDSCKKLGLEIGISLSHEASIVIPIGRFSGSKIYFSPHKLSQFDHIKKLSEGYQGAKNDFIILLDADDMLLPNYLKQLRDIDSYDGALVYHYIGAYENTEAIKGNEDIHYKDVMNYVTNMGPTMIKDNDFSGTIIRYKLIRDLIPKMEEASSHLCDIEIMKYVEDINHICYLNPCVFHRVKSRPSLWKEDVLTMLQKMRDMLRVIEGPCTN